MKDLESTYNNGPIILLGAARSGTKILRDTLAVERQVFAIPYDINYIWRYRNERLLHDELSEQDCDERISHYIRKQIAKLSGIGQNEGIILEKTVASPLRISFINKVFPNARYINLIRNGYDVTESSMRQWKQKPDYTYLVKKLRYYPWTNLRYASWFAGNLLKGMLKNQHGGASWGPRYRGITEDIAHLTLAEICATQWSQCIKKSIEGLKSIPVERQFTLTYEDFVNNEVVIAKLCEFLQVPDETILKKYRKDVVSNKVNNWKKVPQSLAAGHTSDIIDATTKYIDKHMDVSYSIGH